MPACILPKPGYLEFLREITRANGALLIFDEVMTGFRLAKGGAQERFGITPDLSCFGKVIGGGLPVGAFGGRAEIMDCLAPLGPVYQAGTLSGNPVAMAAGIAALEELAASNAYAKLEQLGAALEAGMKDAAKSAGVPGAVQPLRLDVLRLLHQRAGAQPGRRDEERPRAVQEILPRHAGRGHLSRAVAVRGRLPFHRPHRGGHRSKRWTRRRR